jgi:hypothetical protein
VPLNGYGQACRDAGRSVPALQSIEQAGSDHDGSNNLEEIQGLFFPGDSADHPGLIAAPAVLMNQERILEVPSHSQFLFANQSKSTDEYARYRGAKMWELLQHVGIDTRATRITVIAPDGSSKTFPIDVDDPQSPPNIQCDVKGPYPRGF